MQRADCVRSGESKTEGTTQACLQCLCLAACVHLRVRGPSPLAIILVHTLGAACCSFPCNQSWQEDTGLRIMSVKLELRDSHPQSPVLASSSSLKGMGASKGCGSFTILLCYLQTKICLPDPAPTSSPPGTLHIIIHSEDKITPALKAPPTNQSKESLISCPNSMRIMRVVEVEYNGGCVARYIRNSMIPLRTVRT